MSGDYSGANLLNVHVLGQYLKGSYDPSGKVITIDWFHISDLEGFKKHIRPAFESFETKIQLSSYMLEHFNLESLKQINEAFDGQFDAQLGFMVEDIGD